MSKTPLCFRPGPAAWSILPSYCAVMRTIVSQTSHACMCRVSGKKGDISTAAPLEHLTGLDPVVEFYSCRVAGYCITDKGLDKALLRLTVACDATQCCGSES
jgi:hypothetical protein